MWLASRVGAPEQLVDGEPVDDLRHPLADAVEAVEQEVARGVRRHVVHQPSMHLTARRSEPHPGRPRADPCCTASGTNRIFRRRRI